MFIEGKERRRGKIFAFRGIFLGFRIGSQMRSSSLVFLKFENRIATRPVRKMRTGCNGGGCHPMCMV